MNKEAERHLVKAEGHLAKGEAFYRKAAAEIVAAQEADFKLTYKQIGERVGRSDGWVRRLVTWSTDETCTLALPSSEPTGQVAARHARGVLRNAPLEQVEQIISDLPKERQQAIAAAAGDRYAQHRQRHDEEQARQLTPGERREREQVGQAVAEHVGRVAAPFQAMSIESLLEQATDLLREMVEARGVTPAALDPIERALDAFVNEFQVARGMVGLDAYERSDA